MVDLDETPFCLIDIESLAYEGWGVGRTGGRVVFVPATCPGDRAEVRVAEDRGAYLFGNLTRLLREGMGRRPAPCPIAGVCGGCQWQHIDEEVQREQKLLVFQETLKRIGGIVPPILKMTSPRGEPFGYRTRVRVAVRRTGPTFRRAGSRKTVTVRGCPVAVKPLDDLLASWAQKPPAWLASGDFREVEVTWASSGAFQVNLLSRHGRRPRRMRFDTHPEGRTVLYSIDNRWIGQQPPQTWENTAFCTYAIPGEILGEETDLAMLVGPGDFIQPNPAENASLVQAVLDQGSPLPGQRALDLYCGVGNFSLPLAIRGMHVSGIDSLEGAIQRAEENAKRNGVTGCQFQAAHVERAVKKIRDEGKHFDLVLLDPPRSGCKEILEDVAAFRPERIVYVSCNPATLARDLKGLAGRGYRLADSRLVDMFPQTYHIESVNLLLWD